MKVEVTFIVYYYLFIHIFIIIYCCIYDFFHYLFLFFVFSQLLKVLYPMGWPNPLVLGILSVRSCLYIQLLQSFTNIYHQIWQYQCWVWDSIFCCLKADQLSCCCLMDVGRRHETLVSETTDLISTAQHCECQHICVSSPCPMSAVRATWWGPMGVQGVQ